MGFINPIHKAGFQKSAFLLRISLPPENKSVFLIPKNVI